MVFAGVGLVALPLDMIREFWGRPTATIPKSEYVKRARGLGVRANGIKVLHHSSACMQMCLSECSQVLACACSLGQAVLAPL